ncbi:TPA: ABC transporter ATP-binding protein [Candidatus Poribacteria bacterium]|nr:ABC transporter ATP-binding protein [Candidatus Poribacteria bacterium]
MNAVIEVYDLSYKYNLDRSLVLNRINFDVRQGEILGIVGPNGSGKSTLLKLLSGVLKPVEGRILLLGRPLARLNHKSIAKIIAVVPQNTVISFPFTVREIVLMGRSPHLGLLQIERDKDFKISERAMMYTNSLEFADRKIDELSGGERQRVIIARALAQEPQIILLDEPTVHLDLKHQIEIFDLIKQLNIENLMTVVVVSHDLNLAGEYCDRFILLRGRGI